LAQPRGSSGGGGPSNTDPHRLGHDAVADNGRLQQAWAPTDKRIVAGFGFWLFLLSDIIMFSALFATYAVLRTATAGGPVGLQLFDISKVGAETICLVLSSFTCGLAMLASRRGYVQLTQVFLAATGVLGAIFLAIEIGEFTGLLARGAGPDRSAFLSSFFALVGCHGLHVACGLLWLVVMMVQLWLRGFQPDIMRRLMCFSLFWHALDIIWVAVFTVVYLFGTLP
jgi:cytochrome o ubiquinol oxidase subunit III